MEATFYRGGARGSRFPVPVNVGLRPGYVYRVELNGFPNHPGISLFPTLEVIGTLALPPRVRANQYPVPIVLSTDDIEQVLAGAMITKIIYLEDPDRAIPGTGNPDVPVETAVAGSRDLFREANTYGRPLVILRLGQRELSQGDMARQAIPGTILLPGETHLPLPRQGPTVPPITWPWCDPLYGAGKTGGETLHNGYINPNRIVRSPDRPPERVGLPGIGPDGKVHELRPEDTVAEFTDSAGRRGLTVSNRICLVVPQFGIVRNTLPLNQVDSVTGVVDHDVVNGQVTIRAGQPPGQKRSQEAPVGVNGQERASGAIGHDNPASIVRMEALQADYVDLGTGALLGTAELDKLTKTERQRLARQIAFARSLSAPERVSSFEERSGPSVVARVENSPEVVRATVETRDLTSTPFQCPPQLPSRPLCLFKWADRDSAKVGDVVTLFLRYANQGQRPLTDVAVSDSLTSRLEYVPGSAQSSRPAVFTMQANEAGSMLLHWEISGTLHAGDTGVIRFQVKVR